MSISAHARRRSVLLRLMLVAAFVGATLTPPLQGDDQAPLKKDVDESKIAPPTKEELADRRIVFMKTALAHYTVKVGDGEDVARVADPCLRWNNVLSDVNDGIIAVYRFKEGGRPAAVGQFFRNAPSSWVNEFAVISAHQTSSDQPYPGP